MPVRVSWGLDETEPEAATAYVDYEGPTPNNGQYQCRISAIIMKYTNSGDNRMISVAHRINESRPNKKQFNGYTIWGNQNITDQSAPFLKQWLDALGISWKAFREKTIVEQKLPKGNTKGVAVEKLGGVAIADLPNLMVYAQQEQYKGNWELKGKSYVVLPDNLGSDAATSSASEDDDIEEDDGLDVVESDDADSDDVVESDEEETEDDDESPPF